MTPAPLRIAVIWDGSALAQWQSACLEALAAAPGVDLVALIAVPTRKTADRSGARARGAELWRVFDSRYVSWRSKARTRVGVRNELCNIRVDLRPLQRDAGATGLVSRAVADLELDVALDFSSGEVPDAFVRDARFGVWTLGSPATVTSDGPAIPVPREIVNGSAVTTLALLQHRPDGVAVLGTATFRIREHSYVRTLDDALLGVVPLIVRACHDALAGSIPESGTSVVTPEAHTLVPSNRTMAQFLARLGFNFARTQLRSLLLTPQWNVGVVDAPIGRFLAPEFRPSVRWLPGLPVSESRADPFGLPDGFEPEFLVEAYDHETRAGTIMAVDVRGSTPNDGPVLPTDGHASYPYLVAHQGNVYCFPQLDVGTGIRAFRAIRYPIQWEDIGVLVPGVVARDPTAFEHEGRWWMTFTDATTGPMTHLHVWWADDLFGQWHPHARNPVKIDVRSARPAGTPFVHEQMLYRPAQDCSRSYGGAVTICRVDTLTPTEFREEVARVVPPFPGAYAHGCHTLAALGDRTLVDGKGYVFTWAGSRHALVSRLSNRRPTSGGSPQPARRYLPSR
jgi:hypothetical protein